MKINPYVHFNGNCEEAFKYYGKVLGAKTSALMKVGGSPAEEHMPPDWKDKVLHGEVTIDGQSLMGTDAPPPHYLKPQGFSVTLHVDDLPRANASSRRWRTAAASACHTRRPSSPRGSACASTSSAFPGR